MLSNFAVWKTVQNRKYKVEMFYSHKSWKVRKELKIALKNHIQYTFFIYKFFLRSFTFICAKQKRKKKSMKKNAEGQKLSSVGVRHRCREWRIARTDLIWGRKLRLLQLGAGTRGGVLTVRLLRRVCSRRNCFRHSTYRSLAGASR